MTAVFILGLVIGFAVGYGVRAYVSRSRRRWD
jgi:hypothetical protein